MNGEGIARYQRCGGPGASIRRKNAKQLQLIACWKIENMCKHLQLTTYAEASVCPTGPTPHHFNPSRNSDRQTPPTNLSSPWYHGYHGPTIPGWVSQTPFFIRKVCGSSGSANQRDPTPGV